MNTAKPHIDKGKGEVIILLHGLFGALSNWKSVVDFFSKKYRVIISDLEQATLSDTVDHIDHMVKVAGIDHVGLGSDFDGIANGPVGLEDCTKFPSITEELMRRGYADGDIQKILGLNTMRVMEANIGK